MKDKRIFRQIVLDYRSLPEDRELLLTMMRGIQELKHRSFLVKTLRIVPGLQVRVLYRFWKSSISALESDGSKSIRPPFNAEFVLYLLLRREERDSVIGDLIEDYGKVLERFNKRRADIWFYKQVGGSLLPLLRRALVRIGALVWLGRILRRLIS